MAVGSGLLLVAALEYRNHFVEVKVDTVQAGSLVLVFQIFQTLRSFLHFPGFELLNVEFQIVPDFPPILVALANL